MLFRSTVRSDPATAGDHFFKEAKRLLLEGDLHEVPALTTVQALALMSVREAGCGREAKGWVYSGMSFRMACDLGLNLDSGGMQFRDAIDENEEDARKITFWGCYLFDKYASRLVLPTWTALTLCRCWSNYLGRLPQLPNSIVTVPKFDVFPEEEAEIWSAYTDSGFSRAHEQPSRTRAVGYLLLSVLLLWYLIMAGCFANIQTLLHLQRPHELLLQPHRHGQSQRQTSRAEETQ